MSGRIEESKAESAEAHEILPFDVDAGRLIGDLVGMLTAGAPDAFGLTIRSLLDSYRVYFDVEGVRLRVGDFDVVAGEMACDTYRIGGDSAREVAGLLEISPSARRPVTAAAAAIGHAILSSAAAVFERISANAVLHHVAAHDDLTGLLNRSAFTARIETWLAGRADSTRGVLLRVDVDRLTAVNATFGAEAGDAVLRAVSQVLERDIPSAFGPSAMIGRVGGDEFAVLVPDASLGVDLDRRLEGLRERLERPLAIVPKVGAPTSVPNVEAAEVVRTVTVGIAAAGGITTASELLWRAEQASSSGKRRGGGVVVRYDDALQRSDAIRSEVELRLPRALREDELVLYYQPEVDLRTTEVLGAEALVRWLHPTLGLLLPDTFIETLEQSPYALTFGRWVLDHACCQWAAWLEEFGWDREAPPRVRVNITPAQLMDVDFVDIVRNALDEAGLTPQALGLEITERDVVRDYATAERTLRDLAALGVTVAIDDFGTGYSSFGQLRQFTVSALKIDRSFVMPLARSDSDRSIVAAVVSLARSLDLGVVAEGVQDVAAADQLVELGCHRGQGFLYARPLPVPEMTDVLRAGRTGTRV